MIIPEGAVLKLDSKDEYTHVPEMAANYNESMYFHAFDKIGEIGAWLRIGNRPNEGHAEVSCCVYLPNKSVGFMHRKPKITSNEVMAAGGMRFEVLRPFESFSIAYQGELLLLERPHEMSDPGKAFKSNPRIPCTIELAVYGISPMYGGEMVNADGSPLTLDPETAVFRGHTEQHVRVMGHITLNAIRYDIDGFGFRDKSWGPRYWSNFYWYKWLPVTFGPSFGIILAVMGRRGSPPHITGRVFDKDRLVPILDANIESEWDENGYQTLVHVSIRTQEREFLLEGRALSLIPLRHVRTLQDGSEVHARITEAMMEYRCDGRKAYGMSEYMDLIEDGVPISIRELT